MWFQLLRIGRKMKNNNIPEKLDIALNHLARRIKFTKSVNNYLIAKEQFNSDSTAHKIMENLSAFQKDIRQKQYNNQVNAQDLEQLRTLQKKAQDNEVISSYAYSQQEAIGQLREINKKISGLLGIDFATLAKKNRC